MKGGATLENRRNGRVSAFEQTPSSQLGTGGDYDMAKDVWSAAPNIWSTNKSFLEADDDDDPIRPSPVRQISNSRFGQARLDTNSFLASNESGNENALASKLSWGSTQNGNGLSSRSRGQPLSPTKQKQNQGLDSVANNFHGALEDSGLFAGSSPDVDDEQYSASGRQSRQPSCSVNTTVRFRQSPPHATDFTQNQDEAHRAFHADRFSANGTFASAAGNNNVREYSSNGHLPSNGNGVTYSQHLGYATTRGPADRERAEGPSTFQVAMPYGNGKEITVTEEQIRRGLTQHVGDALRSLHALSLDRAQDTGAGAQIIPTRRTSVPQPQHPPQNILVHLVAPPASTQAGPFHAAERRFDPSAGGIQGSGYHFDPQIAPQYRGLPQAGRIPYAQSASEWRGNLHSPTYPASGTPPTGPQSTRSTPASGIANRASHNGRFMGDRKSFNPDHYGFEPSTWMPNTMQPQMGNGYHLDNPRPAQPVRMNPLAHPYIAPVYGGSYGYHALPRIQTRESDQSQVIRSPLLEEFRASSKTNRRFELRDIYNHIVEFSGDQHASRFIQQKLETANSDEKEQVFKEILPNVLQLMTDVFGNYVIQKMFEHGNQSQKKVLANQMKGHVLSLSTQMYGCRVVQKAFEHVLADQQAELVRELDGPNLQILRVVKDQNGNHVVQKAIERIPGQHIQFIVDAHRGQVAKMSTHQYGCRVVQRMLEHCRPESRRIILDELLEHTLPLISDSYGNYVVQHIIQKGEPRDRRQVVDIVLQHLLVFSKHKFASNIVEKSIDCADADQRGAILRGLITADNHGVSPVLGLMKDQYGNYVLQKVHAQLRGAELQRLETEMKRNYPILRRSSYGKQVLAMEKLLFNVVNVVNVNGPSSINTSSRSSRPSSTDASTNREGAGSTSSEQ